MTWSLAFSGNSLIRDCWRSDVSIGYHKCSYKDQSSNNLLENTNPVIRQLLLQSALVSPLYHFLRSLIVELRSNFKVLLLSISIWPDDSANKLDPSSQRIIIKLYLSRRRISDKLKPHSSENMCCLIFLDRWNVASLCIYRFRRSPDVCMCVGFHLWL